MQLKGSLKNLSVKRLIAIFCLEGILFLEIRIYQTLTLIDPQTGFYTDKNDWTVTLFFAFTAVIALINPVLLYLAPLSKAEYIEPERNIPHAVACLLFGLCAGYNSYALIKAPSDGSKTALASGVAGIAALIVLIAFAAGYFTGGKLIQKLKIPALIPVLWALFLTVNNFSITQSYLNNTVLLINIFGDAFLMLFMFQYAKKVSGIYGDTNSPSFIYSAVMCAMLELSAFVTSAVTVLKNGAEASFAEISPYRLFAALFCLTALIVMLKNKAPDYSPAPEEEVIETVPFKAEGEETPSDSPEKTEENTDDSEKNDEA